MRCGPVDHECFIKRFLFDKFLGTFHCRFCGSVCLWKFWTTCFMFNVIVSIDSKFSKLIALKTFSIVCFYAFRKAMNCEYFLILTVAVVTCRGFSSIHLFVPSGLYLSLCKCLLLNLAMGALAIKLVSMVHLVAKAYFLYILYRSLITLSVLCLFQDRSLGVLFAFT